MTYFSPDQVGSLSHPGKSRVRRLGSVGPGQLAVAVQGNTELGVWSVESSSRQTALTSSAQQHSLTAFSFLSPDRVITAGTDCKLKYWSLSSPQECLTLGQTEGAVHGLTSRLVEGAQVYSEVLILERVFDDKVFILSAYRWAELGEVAEVGQRRPVPGGDWWRTSSTRTV